MAPLELMEANPPTSAPALGLGRLIRDIMDVIIDSEDAETMTDVWESAWDRLNETFRRLAGVSGRGDVS